MPFLRLSRDQRGYENTFLLHAPYPGARPRVLYWYRSAPSIRVGRRALDEDAIRAIEEQHPEIEFDWPQILEEANTLPPEVERRHELRPRRTPKRPRDEEPAPPPQAERPGPTHKQRDSDAESESNVDQSDASPTDDELALAADEEPPPQVQAPTRPRNPLLDELVGREIAARLRARYADMQTRIDRAAVDASRRAAWQSRADALNPDSWTSPGAVLEGVQRADVLVDELRREISMTE